MNKKINGASYADMISYGISSLDKHCAEINDLNVFPVPDGDTGTNMLLTAKNGYGALDGRSDDVEAVAKAFATATVYGARGNSGVILSQFFKGISEGLVGKREADFCDLTLALEYGCRHAYAAVANPVEGTMLTVIKDGTNALKANIDKIDSIDEAVQLFLSEARKSLKNTPNLLPVLQKAGVVDSGGAGIIYFFEGIKRYLDGEEPETAETIKAENESIDFSLFNRYSTFEYGYCTEGLLQITLPEDEFDYSAFLKKLESLGDSLVSTPISDKVKLHIHTKTPERVLEFCHAYGSFLTLKIENMSVQHTQIRQKFLCAEVQGSEIFGVVAVAPNEKLQHMLSDMGADVVIMSEDVPSSKDFIEAFEKLGQKEILVFPNSNNSILSAMQAGSLYKNAKVTVLNCRSIGECYSALPIIDFEAENTDEVVDAVNDTISNIYEVAIVHAEKNIKFGNKKVVKNDYFALKSNDILETDDNLDSLAKKIIKRVGKEREFCVLNLYYGKNVDQAAVETLCEEIRNDSGAEYDICVISTLNPVYDLTLSFE